MYEEYADATSSFMRESGRNESSVIVSIERTSFPSEPDVFELIIARPGAVVLQLTALSGFNRPCRPMIGDPALDIIARLEPVLRHQAA